jgi:uncharacterized protein DUF6874
MITMQETRLIRQIAERAAALYGRYNRKVNPSYIESELRIVHEDVVRLRLAELLEADDGNFAHDISGIHQHLDIGKQSQFTAGFCPRFAAL